MAPEPCDVVRAGIAIRAGESARRRLSLRASPLKALGIMPVVARADVVVRHNAGRNSAALSRRQKPAVA